MSVAGEPLPPIAIPCPICPDCEQEMHGIGMFSWMNPPWMILALYCPHCRHPLHWQPVPMDPAPQEPGRIQIPS
jgi:hypothetical protein